MLATPAYDGRIECRYAYGLVESIALCAANGIALHPVWWPGEALVQHARNMLIALAMEGEVDDLLFVDADQEFTSEQVFAILKHNVDCVGAPVRKKSDSEESYNVLAKSPFIPADRATGLWHVDAVGTGFLRLSRHALEGLWGASQPYAKNGQKARMIFELRIEDGQLVGEDTTMCRKLAALGIPVYLDPRFVPVHIGTKRYEGNFLNWISRLQKANGEPVCASHER
jgi:hypothetical protein